MGAASTANLLYYVLDAILGWPTSSIHLIWGYNYVSGCAEGQLCCSTSSLACHIPIRDMGVQIMSRKALLSPILEVLWSSAKQVISRFICMALLNGWGIWSCQLCAVPASHSSLNWEFIFHKVHANIRNQGWPTVKCAGFDQRGVLHLAKKEFDGRFD